jgi:putative Holliday junction resolvase
MDERLTTKQAQHYVEDLKIRRKKKKECEDQISAVIILSAYLEKKRGNSDAPQDV